MSETKFFICRRCGNIIAYCRSSGVPVFCCGEKMQELVPGASDGAPGKHTPVITMDGRRAIVTVGRDPHPMEEGHRIEWIALVTKQGRQRRELKPGDRPEAAFALIDGDEPVAAFAYCNLHSLWKSQ